MRITEAIRVDHEFRHFRKAQTLIQSISSRIDWYNTNMPRQTTDLHRSRAAGVLAALQREISNENLVWEINTYLNEAVPILKLPVEQIEQYIFEGLPEPRPAKLSPLEESLTELMTMRQRNLAAKQHEFAVSNEIAYRSKQNWYMIFNTLTVRPGAYYEVFKRDSQEFKRYIRRVDRLTATSTYGTIRAAIGRDYHSHFAVVEEGGKHGRLHVHVLHFLAKPPTNASDPNLGKPEPTERELHCLRNLWPHGRSAPIIVRYSPNDAWGQANYRWPIDTRTGKPLLIQSPQALAVYMSKYISKGYNSCQRSKLLWRVKKSHKLGSQILNEVAEQLSISTLLILSAADNLKTKLNNKQVPQNLLRLAALRSLKNRLSTTNHNEYKNITAIAKLCTPRLSPLHCLRASTQTIQENNLSNTQYLSTLGLLNEDTFKQAWKELHYTMGKADEKYFPRTTSNAHGTTSTRDHLYNS